ncbi:arginine--tRNA ligase [Methanofollis fontis]|uniref:Arginine--tRNA ligase n=1 Tax=Methanofollis fontis TaxID=2052832 RepID=A0A483CTJ2_9EURY|nr:arginine--tRNA ligase [Methanofollis fontis]TAJ45694.1 arginine--tRNA ligase [Methanofollis fontis]
MFLETYRILEAALRDATGAESADLVDGGEHADFATTIAFSLAKKERKAPMAIAADLAERLAPALDPHGIRVDTKGPYINFHVSDAYVRETVKAALEPGFGRLPEQGGRVNLEHTSANPNGPLHVGHIRNSIIGDTLARAFRKAGYTLEVHYYVNDMGRQIAIVSWGFDHIELAAEEGEKGDHHIARVYVAANRRIEADESIVADIDRLMQQIEAGDPETARKFRAVVSRCLDGFKVTMKNLNVVHDRFVWESDFVRNGDMRRIIEKLDRMPEAIHEGTLAIDLSAFGFEKEYVVRRSDGTSVYAARDLAYHTWKGRNFERVIDVLGADHKLIGSQLQCTLQLMGERPPEIVIFEFVSLPEGSMSTRAGKFISADELIAEVTNKAYDEVSDRRPELPEEEREGIARAVALAAIRYDIVKVSPEKSTVFNWEEALDFERQSGPYVQYSHARACSILEKAGAFEYAYEFTDPHEIALAKQIARFPAVIDQVVRDLRPHLLAIYARDLADLFNSFYRYVPVLRSEGVTLQSRLTLVRAAQNTLKEALETLGIDAISTM